MRTYIGLTNCARCGGDDPNCYVCQEIEETELPRIPSEERGCTGKLNLGKKYKPQADRMARKHGKTFGVYRCPHCDGSHLTTKTEKADQYEPLLYIAEPKTIMP